MRIRTWDKAIKQREKRLIPKGVQNRNQQMQRDEVKNEREAEPTEQAPAEDW